MTVKVEKYETNQSAGVLLNANETSVNLAAKFLPEIQQAVASIAFNRYPDNSQTELLEAYGKVIGKSPAQILAGNGSDQMLGLLIGYYLGKGKKLFTFNPDFSMYDYYAGCYEADVIKYPLSRDGSLDVKAFVSSGLEQNVNLVLFSNPNNPSGHCLTIEEIRTIVEGFQGVPVVVDEAYFEFADEESALSLLEEYENLFVTRTLSKAYALAGLRVGFLVGNTNAMTQLRALAVPYALNAVSMKIAGVVLKHADEILQSVKEVKAERQKMFTNLSSLQTLHFVPSQANFLFGWCDNKAYLLSLFAQNNIAIRNYKNNDTFRITIGTPEENMLVLQILKQYEETMLCAKQ